MTVRSDDRGLLDALLADGRFLLELTGILLALSGGFAIFQSLTGYFLPHDVAALGFDANHLRESGHLRVVYFMFHDRVAFGGTLLAIGCAYWYLAEFGLPTRAAWVWWTFLISGGCGFASFLCYLSYGYLDTWHGIATILLLPVFVAGLWRARPSEIHLRDIWAPRQRWTRGRRGLAFLGAGLIAAGMTIMVVGMTTVFVPQDLAFMHMTTETMQGISPHLIPVIAHDRAGFGGGLFSTGILLLLMARHAPHTRAFVQIIVLMGIAGFGAAIGVHYCVGYTDLTHLAPAWAGFAMFLITAALLSRERQRMVSEN